MNESVGGGAGGGAGIPVVPEGETVIKFWRMTHGWRRATEQTREGNVSRHGDQGNIILCKQFSFVDDSVREMVSL